MSVLPDISFAETDPAVAERQIIAAYESVSGATLYPGDPVRLLLSTLAYVISVQNACIELAGRENLLAFATGGHLDHLGALLGVVRQKARPARVMLRFSLASALAFDVPVPAGTRAGTKSGDVFFATRASAVIAAGATFVDVLAEATDAGASGNGLVSGQICTLVDPVAYIATVTNVSTSTDGDDAETDDHLREKIRLAPETFSVAGPKGAYEALTLAVSTEISAVTVTSPTPGVVDVRFVMQGGALPDAATVALVQAALSADDVRPLTDSVTVAAPDPVRYDISGSWYLSASDAALQASITSRVEAAVNEYKTWQKARPGRDLNPSELIRRVMQAGARRVTLDSPVYTVIGDTSVAVDGTVSFVFGGVENE